MARPLPTAIARPEERRPAWAPALLIPLVALLAYGAAIAVIAVAAGPTLGYDFKAYLHAGQRLLDGARLYDPAVNVAGGFAIFLYPPPFALAMVPFALLPGTIAVTAWTVLLALAFLAGVALLPVRREVRWLVVLLAALQWPFLYSIKLGQVGPLLFLAFAAGWRWLDRPGPLGLSMAAGTLIKLQPGLLFGWALAGGRRRAIAIGVIAIAACALAGTLVTGLAAWSDYVAILRRVSAPVTTPHNFTPGAVAYQMGASEAAASLVQWASMALTIAITAYAWLRSDAETAYVVTAVASQLLSPLLWDHYAMLLLIPTALLLQRRQWWAVLIPLSAWLPLPWIIPVAFAPGLVGPLLTGSSDCPGSVDVGSGA